MESVTLFLFYSQELLRWNIPIDICRIILKSDDFPVLPRIAFEYKGVLMNAVLIGTDEKADSDLWAICKEGNDTYDKTISLSHRKKLDLDGHWYGCASSMAEFGRAVSTLVIGG